MQKGTLDELKRGFEIKTGLTGVRSELKRREGSDILVIKVANPNDRLFAVLEETIASLTKEEDDRPLATIVREPNGDLLDAAEGRLLLRTLSESLNINRYSFQEDFLSRYTKSVFGAEDQVLASANHVVFGRRGSGKSILLLYALHTRHSMSLPSIWVDMQVYARRTDEPVIADILREVLEQAAHVLKEPASVLQLMNRLQAPDVSETNIRRLLPEIRNLLGKVTSRGQELFVFLDDFHVVDPLIQPKLLDVLYAIARGNRTYLKLSAIETLVRTFDPAARLGLEIPHDAQLVRLDYNLTIPDKATSHIESILNAHAKYSGLPCIRKLCTSREVIPRLTWLAAGVPRDALNLFAQAMTKATLMSRSHVSVSNVNVAASETINTKLRDLEKDASGDSAALQALLNNIRDFCVRKEKANAFLVEIREDAPEYLQIRKLVDLRLLHVINEGITVREAGRKYLGLILDYGFYTGIRAARSVDRFNKQTARVAYRDLRKLPVFAP